MAEMATYVGVAKRTAVPDPSAVAAGGGKLARGTRVSILTPPTAGLAPTVVQTPGVTAVGDYVCLADLEIAYIGTPLANVGKPGPVASMHGGGKVPAVGAVATASGDSAYTAANGQFTNVATGATLVGTWVSPCPGAGQLGEVELGV